ncbi:ATP-binding protein [Acrocarpospora catenulata]|uniref:ATP-binding protein n=1 Tax=Acrocarpospora catenulata TaxID=2836182 RepID=UPI001BDAB1C5|nr:LuxR family transcriptional regulator [Acrocarpospora catenulata]
MPGFVGRGPEIAEITRLLALSRLVTLTGVGGIGKSRLAEEVAATASPDFPDGAPTIDLSELRDPGMLAQTVAEALRLDAEEELPGHLAARRVLLILDGADAVVDATARLTETLLRAAPGLRVLVTGRQALDVAGEHLFVVPPMTKADGIALLNARAGRHLVEDGGLCERLDGIPLAIELAADRLAGRSVAEIVRELDFEAGRFQLLDGLRAVIGRSHELCTPAQRLLWARLAVFSGCFDLAAAEEVCHDRAIPAHQVLDLIGGLVARSILTREEGSRYHMPETVREYGAEWLRRLGEEEIFRLRRRHKNYYLRMARRGEIEWFGPDQAAILARTRAEHGNLRSALDFCMTIPGEVRDGLELAAALWFYWVGCGYLGEGRRWLEQGLALDSSPTPERARALWAGGYVAILLGDLGHAVRMLEECRDGGDSRVRARATHRLGCAALLSDEHAEAVPLFEDALDQYQWLGLLDSQVLMGRVELAMALGFAGRLDESARLCQEVRAECAAHGERWVLSYVLFVQAYCIWAAGEPVEASRLARASLEINRTFNDQVGTLLGVELLALAVADTGDHEMAALLQGAADRLWRSVGPPLFGARHFAAPLADRESRGRAALGDPRYEETLSRGRRMGLDSALEISSRGVVFSTDVVQSRPSA